MKTTATLSVTLLAGLCTGSIIFGSCGDDGGGGDGGTTIDAGPNDPDAEPLPQPDAAIAGFCQPTAGTDLQLTEIVQGLTAPLFLDAPKGDPRLFVIEQPGRIRLVKDDALVATPFLDVSAIINSAGNEQGLLGLAFHPDYAQNGRFFINYTAKSPSGDTVVAEYTAAAGADVASPTGKILLTIAQPQSNHNGGMMAFGADGYLYIGTGDGGGGGDDHGLAGNGQNLNTHLGKLLRIDVDSGDPYGIPADNPFATADGLPEIWAYGLRNPWRFSFDSLTGEIYIGDVGQQDIEEIDVLGGSVAGANYGWRIMEASACYNPATGCDMSGKVLPVYEYPHTLNRVSITGGYVYRGACLPDLQGTYFFGDYGGEQIYTFKYVGGAATDLQDLTSDIDPNSDVNGLTSFGEDGYGELYVISGGGSLFRITARP